MSDQNGFGQQQGQFQQPGGFQQQGQFQQPGEFQQPYSAPQAGYSGAAPSFEPRPQRSGAVLAVIIITVVVFVAAAGLFAWALWPKGDGDAAAPVPSASQDAAPGANADPAQPPASPEPPDAPADPDEPTAPVVPVVPAVPTDPAPVATDDPLVDPAPSAPADPSSPATGDLSAADVRAAIQKTRDEWGLGDESRLFDEIPDSQENRFAAAAFQYMLTDYASAAGFIPDSDQDALEDLLEKTEIAKQKLLAQEPLGTDIHITMQDGTEFIYDGDTGEGQLIEADDADKD